MMIAHLLDGLIAHLLLLRLRGASLRFAPLADPPSSIALRAS